ncbi:RNA polymerase sigma factor RpoE [Marinicauda pacifica]|jgi:RNA polymerase sigma-70 factor (ECF subfamily)|nr:MULTISPECIES: RNA polymerase sigma factor [Marinicauda]GGE39144.1 RNA polymerase sigma factor RpoE [Marinicauda pacifica]
MTKADKPAASAVTAGEPLVAAARHGDRYAFDRLMTRDAPRLVRFAISQGLSEDDANDVAQDTFVAVYRNLHRYDPSRPFQTWLFAIARNKLRDHFRRRSVLKWIGAEDTLEQIPTDAPSPERQTSDRQALDATEQAIAKLPEGLRIPLLLASIEGLSLSEIGEIMGISAKAAEVRVYRARRKIKSDMG